MPFPRRLLHDDEQVLVDQNPHLVALIGPAVICIVVLGGIVTGFLEWQQAPTWFGILLGLALLAVVSYGTGKYWSWRSRSVIVTTYRVVHRSGVLRHRTKEISLRSIQDVTCQQNLFERMIGSGTLFIETTGGLGVEEVKEVIDPARVQALIGRAIDAPHSAKTINAPNSKRTIDASTSPSTQSLGPHERLDALRRQGIITEAEYVEMRSALGDSQ